MKETERLVSKEVLERVEEGDGGFGFGDSGNKMLEVTIYYKKDGRPRGYYLCLSVYLETDRGSRQHSLSFGDEGDPYKSLLIEEAKAFSAKRLSVIDVKPEHLNHWVDWMKAEYVRRRDIKKARYAMANRERELRRATVNA